MVEIFETLEKRLTKSQKHFNSFLLNNTVITELKDNTFKDITFESITIEDCNSLTSIDHNAFYETDKVTKYLFVYDNPSLQSKDNSIFKALSKFDVIEKVDMENNNFTEITFNAFNSKSGYQDTLRTVDLEGRSFEKLGSYAFSALRKLSVLYLWSTSINFIPDYAFEFKEQSDETLTINFHSYSINSTGFSDFSFVNLRRPTVLSLDRSGNNIDYLDERTFLPFLKENTKNIIRVNQDNRDEMLRWEVIE